MTLLDRVLYIEDAIDFLILLTSMNIPLVLIASLDLMRSTALIVIPFQIFIFLCIALIYECLSRFLSEEYIETINVRGLRVELIYVTFGIMFIMINNLSNIDVAFQSVIYYFIPASVLWISLHSIKIKLNNRKLK